MPSEGVLSHGGPAHAGMAGGPLMKDESSCIVTHCCWDMDLETNARCTLEPDHEEERDHYTPYVRSSWDRPGRSWPAK
ncbi:hypothetical protein [Streptomyces sp. NPDC048473]|uniref:hypothetical protein n=1 Tax=unclassified Streptomyces TaxID=2593676 RepID=UPI0037126672